MLGQRCLLPGGNGAHAGEAPGSSGASRHRAQDLMKSHQAASRALRSPVYPRGVITFVLNKTVFMGVNLSPSFPPHGFI